MAVIGNKGGQGPSFASWHLLPARGKKANFETACSTISPPAGDGSVRALAQLECLFGQAYRRTPAASVRWMPRTSVPFFKVFVTGSWEPETQIFSSLSRSKVPAVSTEKRVMAR